MDTSELRDALKTMMDEVNKLRKEKSKIADEISVIDQKVAQIEEVIDATRAVQTAIIAGDTAAAAQARPRAVELQAVLLAEEREKQRIAEERAALAARELQERLEREAAEKAAAEEEAARRAEEDRKRAEEEALKLVTSSELLEQAQAMKKEMASLNRQTEKTLEQSLGAALVKKGAKPKDLVAAWDQKHKGCVNKIEFRQGIRKGLGIKAENKEIDELFDSFDDDGGMLAARPQNQCPSAPPFSCWLSTNIVRTRISPQGGRWTLLSSRRP